MPAPVESRARRGAWLVFAAAVLLLAAALVEQRHFFHDDAFITLRYAERWLAGKGLTWNDGERVEGFSSPSWLVQIAGLARLGVPAPLAARGLGLAYTLLLLVLWYRAKAEPAALLALITVPGFALWAWGGLETLSFCFWLLLAMVLIRRMQREVLSRGQASLLAASLVAVALTRPEGIAVALACLGAAWPSRRQPAFLLAAIAVVSAGACYEGFRIWYFNDIIANGARAKALGLPWGVRLENAAIYLGKTAPQWLASVLLSVWLVATTAERRGIAILLLPLLPLVLVVFAGGGDHMTGARFLLAPVAALSLIAGLAPPSPRHRARRTTLGLAALAALWQLALSFANPATPNPAAAIGEIVGRTLAARLPPGTRVATATAGSLPYFAPSLSFIDTLGLNDRHIARKPAPVLPAALRANADWALVPGHHRGDGAYVLSRQPDIVMLGGANGDLAPMFASDFQLLMAEPFRNTYTPWRLHVAVPTDVRPWVKDELDSESGLLPITLYVRRDSAAGTAIAVSGTSLPPPWLPPTTTLESTPP